MTQAAITINYDSALELGITAARLRFNKFQPATTYSFNDDGTIGVPVPNPALIADNDTFLATHVVQMIQSWYNANQDTFRIPTGEWLQRWTAEEKKAIRSMGTTNPQVEAWLDELDSNAIVNMTHESIVQGVPIVCAALEQAGVIATGQASVRAAAIMALNV